MSGEIVTLSGEVVRSESGLGFFSIAPCGFSLLLSSSDRETTLSLDCVFFSRASLREFVVVSCVSHCGASIGFVSTTFGSGFLAFTLSFFLIIGFFLASESFPEEEILE